LDFIFLNAPLIQKLIFGLLRSNPDQIQPNMSDDEEYDYGSDDSVQYSDDGGDDDNQQDDSKIEVENAFYEASDMRDDNKQGALGLFNKVITLDNELEERGEPVLWRFKALQNLVTLHCELRAYDAMVSSYRLMLKDMHLATRNECTEAIDLILDTVSTASEAVLKDIFEITLSALTDTNNERLWSGTNIKLAKLYLKDEASPRIDEVEKILKSLKSHCRDENGKDDLSKANTLLETYALELLVCARTSNSMRMKEILPKTENLNAAVADPRIMGVIREEGGKMMMRDADWSGAYDQLNEAFRNYQQAGQNVRAKSCLKYVALTSMLSRSEINPFDAREAKVFERDTDIVAMTQLRMHLQDSDLRRFENVLLDKKNGITDDSFMMQYIHPLRTHMREKVLITITRPYVFCSCSSSLF
jgi:COP9 signalosome complex subunit 2